MRDPQGGVLHLARLFAEDGSQELLLSRKFSLALWRNLADEDVARIDLRADADDAHLVEITEAFLADIWNVAGDLFRTELRVTRLHFVLLDVD